MISKYDIFISYRRDGGESTARIIRDKLTEQGYRVFLDVESLRSGDFNAKLYSVIEECKDFLLILPPGGLDRCGSEDDWVRREAEYALEREKNVIPVMLRGFVFPDSLPASLEGLRYKNGIESNFQFFDAFIDKLQSFLYAKPSLAGRLRWRPWYGVVAVSLVLLVLAAAIGIGITTWGRREKPLYPETASEKNLTGSLLYYVQNNMVQMEQAVEYLDDAYLACEQYLDHPEKGDRTALLAELQGKRRMLYQMDVSISQMPEELYTGLQDSPFSVADATALYDHLELFVENSIGSIYFLEFLTDPDTYLDWKTKTNVLENYREILQEEMKIMAWDINNLLLPVENPEVLKSFQYEFLPQLYYIPLQASRWSTDKELLASEAEKSWNAISRVMERVGLLIGESNMELLQERAGLIRDLMEDGMSLEEAEEQVGQLLGKSQLLAEKKAQLQQEKQRLEEMLEEARQKFAPREEDGTGTLWNKMRRFMNLGLYDEAEKCVEAYREKAREEDPHTEEYCEAAVRLIRNAGRTGIDYGLLVIGYEQEQQENSSYQIGDVIIAVNGTPSHNFEEFSRLRETAMGEDTYTVTVLRATGEEGGYLEQVELTVSVESPKVLMCEMTDKVYP